MFSLFTMFKVSILLIFCIGKSELLSPFDEQIISQVLNGPLLHKKIILFSQDNQVNFLNESNAPITLYDLDEFAALGNVKFETIPESTLVLVLDNFPSEFLNYIDVQKVLWRPKTILIIWTSKLPFDTRIVSSPGIKRSPRLTIMIKDKEKQIYDIYISKPYFERKIDFHHIHLINQWNSVVFQEYKVLFPNRFKDFEKATLPLFGWCTDFPDYYIDPVTLSDCVGVYINLAKAASRQLNFLFTMENNPKGYSWGVRYKNGSYDGILGAVQRREVDFSINPFFRSIGRITDFQATTWVEHGGFGFGLRIPTKIPDSVKLALVYTPESWIALVLMIVLLTPLLRLFSTKHATIGEFALLV